MNETPQEYTARILSYVEGKDPLKIISASPKKILKLLKGVNKKALYKKPAPEKWSIAEIVAHLAETELVNAWRFRIIAEKNAVHIQPFDQNVWEKNGKYYKTDVNVMLNLYLMVRDANVRFIKGLPKEMLEQYGMHAERGKESIMRLMNLEAGHDLNHLRQIELILSHKKK